MGPIVTQMCGALRRCEAVLGLAAVVLIASYAPAQVVIEHAHPAGVGNGAGIQSGDIFVAWRAEQRGGAFSDPMQVRAVQVEQAALGDVTVTLLRDGDELNLVVPVGVWGLSVRPLLDEAMLAKYSAAGADRDAGNVVAAVESLQELALVASDRGDHHLAAWLLVRAFQAAEPPLDPSRAEQLQHAASSAAERAGDLRFQAWVEHYLGEQLARRNLLEPARTAHHRALELRQRLDPGGLTEAESWLKLGNLAFFGGDPNAAEQYWQRSAEIRERQAPLSLDHADLLNNLGVAAQYLGRLDEAEQLLHRCLTIREQLGADASDRASVLTNLGGLAMDRGDLIEGERCLRRALDILQAEGADQPAIANCLYNLGGVAHRRGDLVAADHYFQRSLELRTSIDAGSLGVAGCYAAIAAVALARRDLDRAEHFNQRALAIRQRLAPESADLAENLGLAATIARKRGDLRESERLRRVELQLCEKVIPDSEVTAGVRRELAELLAARGELDLAERLVRSSMEFSERNPGTPVAPEALYVLATVARARGEQENALRFLEQAISAVEHAQQRLGGAAERRGTFRENYIEYYREMVQALIESDRPADALHVLERSRAQAQLAMLAERDLMFGGQIPADLERRRRRLASEADRVLAEVGLSTAADADHRGVGGLLPADGSAPDPSRRLLDRLQDLRRQQEEVRAEIRSTSSRVAALNYPEPLDVAAIESLLESGTVLLSYCIGEQASYLFVIEVGRKGVAAYGLETDAHALRQLVEELRRQLRVPQADLGSALEDLGQLLLEPAATAIARSQRLVIIPDGPLHLLPFAAVLMPGDGRYLVEVRPLSVVASATMLAELKASTTAGRQDPVVAFGAPLITTLSMAGQPLAPLPGTRSEVERVRRLYAGAATVWLGEQATEVRVKRLAGPLSVLHLAVHGVVDQNAHLESTLILAADGDDNGLLQSWEILDQMRLEADLVTLSACETALGQEISGEGLLGLSSAFLIAGARTVLASLWSVADASTAELMGVFYEQLRAGKAKDEALRAAQRSLIESDETNHPFYWAAFQLIGDPR